VYAWAVGRDRNICTMERANQNFKIFEILKNDKFEQKFETLNDFRCKSDEYKSCSTHKDLQLLFWSSYHLTKFEPFKFEILKNNKFEPRFETQNDFNIKSDAYQSCSTH